MTLRNGVILSLTLASIVSLTLASHRPLVVWGLGLGVLAWVYAQVTRR